LCCLTRVIFILDVKNFEVPLLKPAGLDVKYTLAPAGSQKPG